MNAASEANLETYKQLAWTLISFINWCIINYKKFIYNIIYYEFFFFENQIYLLWVKTTQIIFIITSIYKHFYDKLCNKFSIIQKKNFVSFLVFYFILDKL